jgi:hypothetical protein
MPEVQLDPFHGVLAEKANLVCGMDMGQAF